MTPNPSVAPKPRTGPRKLSPQLLGQIPPEPHAPNFDHNTCCKSDKDGRHHGQLGVPRQHSAWLLVPGKRCGSAGRFILLRRYVGSRPQRDAGRLPRLSNHPTRSSSENQASRSQGCSAPSARAAASSEHPQESVTPAPPCPLLRISREPLGAAVSSSRRTPSSRLGRKPT